MRRLILNNMPLFYKLIKNLIVVLGKWLKYFWFFLLICILSFIEHFLTEFFPFYIQSKKFVKKRFLLWYDWNFNQYWGFFRILFFFLTLFSFAKPIYFFLRWIGFIHFFLWNIIFMLWRAFFFGIFLSFFDWYWIPPLKARMMLMEIYKYFSPLGNRLSLFIARGFGLYYIDSFVSYLGSLSNRNWEKWLIKKVDIIFDFLDEIVYLCKDLYEWYDWYKVEILWWTPYYWHQTKGFFRKTYYWSLYFLKRILRFLRKWISWKRFKFYKKVLDFYFFTKYGRILIKTQINAYFTIFRWFLTYIYYQHIKYNGFYYFYTIKHYIKYYLIAQLLVDYCVITLLFILGFFDLLIDIFIWFFCESIFFILFFKHIYNFFFWISFFFYNKISKRFFIIRKYYYKSYYRLRMSLQHIPFWNYILNKTFLRDIFSLNKEMVDAHIWNLFIYAKKQPFKKAVYDENGKISFVEVTNHIEKEHIIVQYLIRLREEWEWEGEIPPDHLMWLEEIKQELIIEEIIERERKEKEEALKIKNEIAQQLTAKKEEAELRGHTILSLNDYFEKKAKN